MKDAKLVGKVTEPEKFNHPQSGGLGDRLIKHQLEQQRQQKAEERILKNKPLSEIVPE